MGTNLQLSDQLIARAVDLGHHRTKREAVTVALEQYVCRLEQERILPLFGSADIDPDYDYKEQRGRP